MSDEDSDDDLWAEFDDEDDDGETTLTISANLLTDAHKGDERNPVVHKGDADEGKITWESPAKAGVQNSERVTKKERHWYKDNADANLWTVQEAQEEKGTMAAFTAYL